MAKTNGYRKLHTFLNMLPAINNAMYVACMTIADTRGDEFLEPDIFSLYYVINGILQYHALRFAGFCIWTRMASLVPVVCTTILLINDATPATDLRPTALIAAGAATALTTYKIAQKHRHE